MNIGISCYPVYGGSGVVATELGKALAQRGHQIHFIAYSIPFRLEHITRNIAFHEVSVTNYPLFQYPPYALSLTSMMVDVAKFEALDLLHVHYAIPHATSAVLAREILERQGIRIPVVTTLHGTDITIVGQDPSFLPVVKYSIDQSDGVTAVSKYLRDETIEAFGTGDRIEVIPNFIDAARFKRRPNDSLRRAMCAGDEHILIHISNFRPVKNASHVVRVLRRLRRQGLAVRLLFVGDGPDRPAVEHLARELGVHKHVRFLGKQGPVEEILSIADVFLMPSGSESFGLAALEAMACGVPVVSSDAGGLPELLNGSDAGYICPLGDIDTYTKRCMQLFRNQAQHKRMATSARQYAVRHFQTAAVVSQYETYYEQVRTKVGTASGNT